MSPSRCQRHQEIPAQHRSIVTYGAAIAKGAPWRVAVQLLEEGTRGSRGNRLGEDLQIKMLVYDN